MKKFVRLLREEASNNTYYWCLNFSPNSIKLHDNGKFENIEGTLPWTSIPGEGISNLEHFYIKHVVRLGNTYYTIGVRETDIEVYELTLNETAHTATFDLKQSYTLFDSSPSSRDSYRYNVYKCTRESMHK